MSESGLFHMETHRKSLLPHWKVMIFLDIRIWNGSKFSTTTVSMVEDRNLTANFTIQTFTLSVSINGQGSITGAGNFNYDDLPTISATPSTGYSFLN